MDLRRLRTACAVPLALVAVVAAPAAAQTGGTPPGWRADAARTLAPGLDTVRLVRDAGPVVVDVARIRPDHGLSVRTVVAGDRVATSPDGLERTTSICARARCLVAVNGDFATAAGAPVGGAVTSGVMVRSPSPNHHQATRRADGTWTAGTLDWNARLVASDLRELRVHGVNVARGVDQLVLHTPSWGSSTRTNAHGVEVVLRIVEPAGPLRVDRTALVELVARRSGVGDAPIPPDGLVLSGHGRAAAALDSLWSSAESGVVGRRALVRIETATGAAESVGGTPVLVRDGRRWVADDGSALVSQRHPRTVIGWLGDGTTVLLTVDGRRPGHSIGLTLPETADLLVALGAREALNLDGGGSTTFVEGGAVRNAPSDVLVRRGAQQAVASAPARGDVVLGTVERPVASAVVVVAEQPAGAPVGVALGGAPLGLPVPADGRTLLALAAPADDPASATGSHPAVVTAFVPAPARPPGPLLAAIALDAAALVGAVALARRRRPRPTTR